MIDPTFVDITDEELPSISSPSTSAWEARISELENINQELQSDLEFYRSLTVGNESRVERLKEYILEIVEVGDIETDVAEQISEIMMFELSKDYYFDVTVQFSGTISLKPGEDAEDILSDMHFEMRNDYHADNEFDLTDAEVQSVNILEA
jgi:hypothetical protein